MPWRVARWIAPGALCSTLLLQLVRTETPCEPLHTVNKPVRSVMDIYRSDKGSSDHKYTEVYDALLPHRRCDVRRLLEIGIGSLARDVPASMYFVCKECKDYLPGASLRGWRDFFPRAEILGLDVDSAVMFEEERISTRVVNSLSSAAVASLTAEVDGLSSFDVVVDDGLHEDLAQMVSMYNFWPLLRVGGTYLLEDIHLQQAGKFLKELHAGGHSAFAASADPERKGSTIIVATKSAAMARPFASFFEQMLPLDAVPEAFVSCWKDIPVSLVDSCCGVNGSFPRIEECWNLRYFYGNCCPAYIVLRERSAEYREDFYRRWKLQ